MKLFQNILGFLGTFCLILTLLITSVEAVTYWMPGYYEKEYTKYNVAKDVSMEMEDLLYVTTEMMSFLRGGRDNLHVISTINGQQQEFFNQREIAHMEDVQFLFINAIKLRRITIFIIAVCILLLYFLKAPVKWILAKSFCIGSGFFVIATALLTLLISTDFTKYFTIFHEIFFTNDLWLLNPATDRLINIVPEPFFIDTALRIGILFFCTLTVLFSICFAILRYESKKKINSNL